MLVPFAEAPEFKIQYAEFDDSPNTVRWRAWWDSDGERVRGIRVSAYPVLRVTPSGAWIDPDAYHHGGWVTYEARKRWVSDTGASSWAKSTKAEALNSLAARHKRWVSRAYNDIGYLLAASDALEKLLPDFKSQCDLARRLFPRI